MAHLTEIIRPSGNVNTLWFGNTYTLIDDVVQEPTAGDNSFASANDSDDNEIQEWIMSRPSGNYDSITGLTLWSYVKVGSTTGDIGISIEVSGNVMPETVESLTTTYTWFKSDFTLAGNPTINDLTAVKLRCDARTRGKTNAINYDVGYVVVSGVAVGGGGGPAVAVARNPNVANDIFSSPIVIGL